MTDEMIEMPIVRYRSQKARELADLDSILLDLRSILESCRRLIQLIDSESGDAVLLEALWTSSLVRYVRCFSHGRRAGLRPEILDEIIEGAREAHQFFKEIRDKHISHSVNPFEQVEVGVILTPENKGIRKVEGISTLLMRQNVTSREGMVTLYRLVQELGKKVSERRQNLWNEVLIEAQEISVKDHEQNPRLGLKAPDSEDVGTARA